MQSCAVAAALAAPVSLSPLRLATRDTRLATSYSIALSNHRTIVLGGGEGGIMQIFEALPWEKEEVLASHSATAHQRLGSPSSVGRRQSAPESFLRFLFRALRSAMGERRAIVAFGRKGSREF
jgi:hypothetical protein